MTLFEMLSGRLPWEEHDLAKVEERLKSGRRALPDNALSTYAPHVPDRLRRVVNKAIARKASVRFRSAEEFIRALSAAKLKSIDWKHETGIGLVGMWTGTWPPKRSIDKRTTYRVTSRTLESGRDRGKLRLEAHYRKPGSSGWRQAVKSATVSSDDRAGVKSFFEQVEARAAQREPAR